MAKNSFAKIISSDIGSNCAYIYCITAETPVFKKDHKFLYIGQTRQSLGALGRLAQHLSENYEVNTFRQRVEATSKVNNVQLENIYFYTMPFSPLKVFSTIDSYYREAVESLVQDKVLDWIISSKFNVAVVSRVSNNTRIKLEKDVILESDRIFLDLKTSLQTDLLS